MNLNYFNIGKTHSIIFWHHLNVHFIDRNLLSEFDEFETGVIECHKQLKQQSECAENGNKVNTHDSLQSLNSSFEDLQQRYKQLSEDSARKIHVSKS